MLGSTVVQYTTFVVIFSSWSVSGGFSLVGFSPFILVFRCLIFIFIDFSRCFLISFSVRLNQVFRKPCLIELGILAVVELKSSACKYWTSYVFEVCAIILFTAFSDSRGPRGTSNIFVFLFLVPLIIYSPLFWMGITCLFISMVHPYLHKTPNDINGAVCIFGKMWICLASLLILCSCSVEIFVNSIVVPYGSLTFISLSIISGAIVGVACLVRRIFAPETVIASILVLFGLGGVSIWFVKLILGLLILILLSIAPNRQLHSISLPPILFLWYDSSWCHSFFAEQFLLP